MTKCSEFKIMKNDQTNKNKLKSHLKYSRISKMISKNFSKKYKKNNCDLTKTSVDDNICFNPTKGKLFV